VGVLGTTRGDGGTRQSVVYYVLVDERILISTLGGRGKARDVESTGRASLCVHGPERPFPSVTVEGVSRIRRHDITEPMAHVTERVRGEPVVLNDEEWAALDRVLLEIAIERVYGASYLDLSDQQRQ
jgi:hypothetical protein